MPVWRRTSGFTLIELLVSLSITAMLMLAIAPFMGDWSSSSQTGEARSKLVLAYGAAKALAVRNPSAIHVTDDSTGVALPAAGLKIVESDGSRWLLVCVGDPTAATCTTGGASVRWRASYSTGIATTLGGVASSSSASPSVGLNNRGVALSSAAYRLSRGSSTNDETGTLV